MQPNLVIVESPAKAKTIEKFLGKDFKVLSSYGHIRDLKKRDFSIDIAKDYSPVYEIPADKKQPIESALQRLKDAHKAQDVAAINSAIDELNRVFQAASQEMYNAQQQGASGAQSSQGAPNNGQQSGNNGGKDQEVTDVDFEEVK